MTYYFNCSACWLCCTLMLVRLHERQRAKCLLFCEARQLCRMHPPGEEYQEHARNGTLLQGMLNVHTT
jgi:hypothetical protein